jgi:rubrerythrin
MMKATSGPDAKWTVFFAASCALVVSTLVAVMIGSKLTEWVPPFYIKFFAGVLFLVFGALLVRDAFYGESEPSVPVEAPHGAIAKFAFEMAAGFEKAAAAGYRKSANEVSHPELRKILNILAEEEERHLSHLSELVSEHGNHALGSEIPLELPRLTEFPADIMEEEAEIIKNAIHHEENTAAFYSELARRASIPSLREAFAALAAEERDHASRLKEAIRANLVG